MMLSVIGGSFLEKNCYGHDTLRFNFLIKYSVLFDQSLEISIERTGGRILFPLSRRLTQKGYYYIIICLAGIRISILELEETSEII